MSTSRSTIHHRSVLSDASNSVPPPSSSRARRKSFCVSDRSNNQIDATPSKADRRALLAEWRKAREIASGTSTEKVIVTATATATTHPSGIPSSAEAADTKKRSRIHDHRHAPPLPPSGSSSNDFVTAIDTGVSARERIRQRRRLQDESPRIPMNPASCNNTKSSIQYYDEDDDATTTGGYRLTARSPLLRCSLGGARRRSISTSARRGRGAPSPMLSMSQESEGKNMMLMPLDLYAFDSSVGLFRELITPFLRKMLSHPLQQTLKTVCLPLQLAKQPPILVSMTSPTMMWKPRKKKFLSVLASRKCNSVFSN